MGRQRIRIKVLSRAALACATLQWVGCGANTPTATTPVTTPAAIESTAIPDVSGTWTGVATTVASFPGTADCTYREAETWTITQSGASLSFRIVEQFLGASPCTAGNPGPHRIDNTGVITPRGEITTDITWLFNCSDRVAPSPSGRLVGNTIVLTTECTGGPGDRYVTTYSPARP